MTLSMLVHRLEVACVAIAFSDYITSSKHSSKYSDYLPGKEVARTLSTSYYARRQHRRLKVNKLNIVAMTASDKISYTLAPNAREIQTLSK